MQKVWYVFQQVTKDLPRFFDKKSAVHIDPQPIHLLWSAAFRILAKKLSHIFPIRICLHNKPREGVWKQFNLTNPLSQIKVDIAWSEWSIEIALPWHEDLMLLAYILICFGFIILILIYKIIYNYIKYTNTNKFRH